MCGMRWKRIERQSNARRRLGNQNRNSRVIWLFPLLSDHAQVAKQCLVVLADRCGGAIDLEAVKDRAVCGFPGKGRVLNLPDVFTDLLGDQALLHITCQRTKAISGKETVCLCTCIYGLLVMVLL